MNGKASKCKIKINKDFLVYLIFSFIFYSAPLLYLLSSLSSALSFLISFSSFYLSRSLYIPFFLSLFLSFSLLLVYFSAPFHIVFLSSSLAISPVLLYYLLVVPTRSLNSRRDFTRSCFEHHSHLKHVSIVQTHPYPASKSVLFMSSSLTTCCCNQCENMKGISCFHTLGTFPRI